MSQSRRKHPRLKEYDYSQNGAYFVTIHTHQNCRILSEVGRGLAPAEACVTLTSIGRVAEKQLFALEARYPYVSIERYVIMPNHIHILLQLTGPTAGASPRPTLCEIIGTYKSLTTRLCNKLDGTEGRKIFQTSFYEHIVRSEQSYCEICQYIDGNPAKWLLEKS